MENIEKVLMGYVAEVLIVKVFLNIANGLKDFGSMFVNLLFEVL